MIKKSELTAGRSYESSHRTIVAKPFLRTMAMVALSAALATSTVFAGQSTDGDGAAGDGTEVQYVSPELLEMIEAWQEKTAPMTLAELVSESHPDVLAMWRDKAAGALGGSILSFYQGESPELVYAFNSDYLDSESGEASDEAFVDYLIHHVDDGIAQLDRDVTGHEGQDFQSLIVDAAPQVFEEFDLVSEPRPVHNTTFLTFVNDYADPEIQAQAQTYITGVLQATATPPNTCECQINASAVNSPSSQIDNNHFSEVRRNNGTWKSYEKIDRTKRGAARRLFSDRFIRNGLTAIDDNVHRSSAYLQLTMSCFKLVGNSMEQCDQGAGCNADLRLDARYESDLWVENQATGVPGQSKGSSAMAADLATLTLNPGSSNELVLFEKGLALQRNYNTTTDAKAVLDGITSAYNLYTSAEEAISGDNDFNDLLADLNDEDINNVLGVMTHNGSRGSSSNSFAVRYSTVGGSPLTLSPGQSQRIELESFGKAKSRGWGKTSRGQTLSASNYYAVGVANNFSCTNAYAPDVTAAWVYDSVWQAPINLSGMKNAVEGFIAGETGVSVNASGRASTYP